jgi:polyphosphate kinase 2
MSKKKRSGKAHRKKENESAVSKAGKLDRKLYEKELARLQAELVKLQFWLKESGERVVVVFEGRDAAGKGGVIKRITERVSPRVFRTVALPAPSEREKTQLHGQRYLSRFPSAGEVILFDRSWYNRAGVERVMGYCSDREYRQFMESVPVFERMITSSGVKLIKYWLEVDQEEQTRRFQDRMTDPRKLCNLSPTDLEAHRLWYDYSRARDAMLAATHSEWAPWYIVPSNDKRRARLNCITHLLSQIPYKMPKQKKTKLPKRQPAKGYKEPDLSTYLIPQPF